MTVELEDVETREKSLKNVQLLPVPNQYRTELSKAFYTVREVGGITVLENRRLYVQGEGESDLKQCCSECF